MTYTDHYFHCGTEWTDDWDCMCNDRCPVCNGEIEPYYSVDWDGNEVIHAPAVYKAIEDGAANATGDAV